MTQLFPLAIVWSGANGEAPPPAVAGGLRDILWHTLWPTLSTLRPEETDLLRLALRDRGPEQMVRDAAEVYVAIRRSSGEEAARRFADDIRARLPGEDARRQFTELLSR